MLALQTVAVPLEGQVIFDYHPFPDTLERMYVDDRSYIFAIHPVVDSIAGDTTWYSSFPSITKKEIDLPPDSDNCYLTDYHWAFNTLETRPDGDIVFTTSRPVILGGESPAAEIFIKTNAEHGEMWLACDNSILGYPVYARVTEITEEEIHGVMDSVKYIEFVDADTNLFHDLYISIGKATGLVHAVNFLNFDKIDIVEEWINQYEKPGVRALAGLEGNPNGVRNLKAEQVYDFQPGDVFHIEQKRSLSSLENVRTTREKQLILELTDLSDSIHYQVAREAEIETTYPTDVVVSYERDTLRFSVSKTAFFDLLPGAIGEVYGDSNYVYMRTWNGLDAKYIPDYYTYYESDECLRLTHVDGCASDAYYLRGAGGPYATCIGWGAIYSKKLVYYQKGDEEWGEPFDFTVSNDLPGQLSHLDIYPNPASGYIMIAGNEIDFSYYDITDITGRKVIASSTFSSNSIDVSSLQAGVYIIRSQASDGGASIGKFIVSR